MKKIIFISLLAIFAISGGFLTARALDNLNRPSPKPETETPVEKPVENSTPVSPPSHPESSETDSDGKTPIKYDGDNPNDREELTAYFSVSRLDGDRLTLRVNIDQYLPSGVCSLKLTDASGNLLVENSVEIIPEASTSTCAGFDLSSVNLASSAPVSALSDAETPLTATLILSSGDKTGTLISTLE